jgi:SAM-dependent methyltransferase
MEEGMSLTKEWDWEKGFEDRWLEPIDEAYSYANRWKRLGFKDVLDLGCGLGRHAIYFAREGFNVRAFDLSQEAVDYLTKWAAEENLPMQVEKANMLKMPYPDNSLDAIFSIHVITHTDTEGIRTILSEILRVLRPGGEIFFSLAAKECYRWSFKHWPMIDENTLQCTDEGPEKGVPHFHADKAFLRNSLSGFKVRQIQLVNSWISDDIEVNRWHYYLNLAKKG